MPEKSVAQKAHVKPANAIAVLHPVENVVASLGLPKDIRFVPPKQAKLIFLFVPARRELETRMPAAVKALAPGSALWVVFRKGSKGQGLDMNRNDVWAVAERLGLRPVGIVSVDDTWSAFRLRPATEHDV